MVELLAAVVAIQTFREFLGESSSSFHQLLTGRAALIKGYSAEEDACELVGMFWDLVLELRCSVYVDRLPG